MNNLERLIALRQYLTSLEGEKKILSTQRDTFDNILFGAMTSHITQKDFTSCLETAWKYTYPDIPFPGAPPLVAEVLKEKE